MTKKQKENKKTGSNESNHIEKRWRGAFQNVWQQQCTHIEEGALHEKGRRLKPHPRHTSKQDIHTIREGVC